MPNWLSSAASWATSPLVPQQAIRPLQDALDSPSLERGPIEAGLRGFGAGALEGLRGLTTPLDVATLALPLFRGARVAPAAARGLAGAAPEMGRSAAAALDVLNPATMRQMNQMYESARPTVRAMENAGTFAGDRSVGGLHRVAETLGEQAAEHTPVGGEAMYNLGQTMPRRPMPRSIDDAVAAMRGSR